MRVYIELRDKMNNVKDWRVVLDDNDATAELLADKVCGMVCTNGLEVGDGIGIFESDKTPEQLKYR